MGSPVTRILYLPIAALIAAVLNSCGPVPPDIPGFNGTGWKSDKHGCAGKRIGQRALLETHKSALLAQPETGILAVLGKPDQVELYKRNQKLYHYSLSGGKGCESDGSPQVELVVRFNAMGRAKEIFIQ